jgi:hypothetical protein
MWLVRCSTDLFWCVWSSYRVIFLGSKGDNVNLPVIMWLSNALQRWGARSFCLRFFSIFNTVIPFRGNIFPIFTKERENIGVFLVRYGGKNLLIRHSMFLCILCVMGEVKKLIRWPIKKVQTTCGGMHFIGLRCFDLAVHRASPF